MPSLLASATEQTDDADGQQCKARGLGYDCGTGELEVLLQTGAITNYDASTRGTSGQMIYGASVSWDFLPSWTARFDWDHSKGDDGTNPDYNVDMYTLGIAYRF